jgi:hypothetical protein
MLFMDIRDINFSIFPFQPAGLPHYSETIKDQASNDGEVLTVNENASSKNNVATDKSFLLSSYVFHTHV